MDVRTGRDGLVRKVVLEYKLPNEKKHRLVDRPIQGIAVIVPIEEKSLQNNELDPEAAEFYPDNYRKNGSSNPGMLEQ